MFHPRYIYVSSVQNSALGSLLSGPFIKTKKIFLLKLAGPGWQPSKIDSNIFLIFDLSILSMFVLLNKSAAFNLKLKLISDQNF